MEYKDTLAVCVVAFTKLVIIGMGYGWTYAIFAMVFSKVLGTEISILNVGVMPYTTVWYVVTYIRDMFCTRSTNAVYTLTFPC